MFRAYLFVVVLLLSSFPAEAETIQIGFFDGGDLSSWEEKRFAGKTEYVLKKVDGRRVLCAMSSGSASGMFKKVDVDLGKTPYLNWAWKVDNTLGSINEKSKDGDDYPARVYVVFSGGLAFWKTRALNYVWSSNQKPGSSWPNAFTSNAIMTAVEAGDGNLGRWLTVKRNIREDFINYFGTAPGKADAVAVMTDTDNAGGKAKACYGNIFFSSE